MRKKLIINILLTSVIFVGCSKPKEITSIDNPTGIQNSLPRLFTDNDGNVFMSWVEETDTLSKLYYSKYSNRNWSNPVLIQESDSWFVNWADFPSIIATNGTPMATHWLKKIPGSTYSYNVEIAPFLGGQISNPKVPHEDNTATEHGFVSMTPISDSSFYAIWLDGRNTAGGHGEHGDLSSAMTLRGTEIATSGETLSEEELDANVCDCCNTAIAKTSSGLIAAYRNRTENEIRDIYVQKRDNGIWQEGKPVHNDNWEIAACPVNGPSIDIVGKTVSVAWFTGANGIATVKLAFSLDEGDSFMAPIIIDSVSALGRVDVIANNKNSAWISWMSRTDETGLLNLRLVSISGEILESHVISEINPSRGSGFPQITRLSSGVMLAWTDYSESGKSIKTAILQ